MKSSWKSPFGYTARPCYGVWAQRKEHNGSKCVALWAEKTLCEGETGSVASSRDSDLNTLYAQPWIFRQFFLGVEPKIDFHVFQNMGENICVEL